MEQNSGYFVKEPENVDIITLFKSNTAFDLVPTAVYLKEWNYKGAQPLSIVSALFQGGGGSQQGTTPLECTMPLKL